MKKIDANQSVYQLVKDHPAIREILVELGFDKIIKGGMLESVGRFMTLKKGINHKKKDAQAIKQAFNAEGYDVEGLS